MSFFTTRHAPNDKLKNYHSSEFIKYDVDVLVRLSSGTKNAPCREGKSGIFLLSSRRRAYHFYSKIIQLTKWSAISLSSRAGRLQHSGWALFTGRVPQSGWSTCAVMLIPYTRKRISPS
jgi:hypothetical protein